MQKRKRARSKKAGSAPQLDFSFMRSATVITAPHESIDLILIGCGGTGSQLAPGIARLMRAIKAKGGEISAAFVDPDHVEEKNIGRQFFCDAEVGFPKAQTLAARYNAALGLDIQAITEPFTAKILEARYQWNKLTVMIGCVDNAAARQEIAQTLDKKGGRTPPRLWWLDCGNSQNSGQVLLGSTNDTKALKQAVVLGTRCQHLPSPTWQCPNLLKPQPEEINSNKMSCAELALADLQALNVNQRVAVEAADLLTRLLLTENLRRFATYFDLDSGSVRNYYIVEGELQKFTTKKRSPR